MTRTDRDSLVDMLAKVSVTETRGSLLIAIDKCEFDADEMLMLAKVLKASILGHNDLVEFYLSESSSQCNLLAQQQHLLQQQHKQQQQIQLLSATPSLRSSAESTSSSPSTPLPPADLSGSSSSSSGVGASGGGSGNCNGNGNSSSTSLQLSNGDPDATIRLLLQMEQLKTFIPQVTKLFESVIELYKNSVDTINHH